MDVDSEMRGRKPNSRPTNWWRGDLVHTCPGCRAVEQVALKVATPGRHMLASLENLVEHSRSTSTLVADQTAYRFKDEFGQLNDAEKFSFPPIPFVDGEPVFRMFVLGTRGAGKTVFLASLYNQLKTQDDSRNNYSVVVTSGEHRGFLIDTYDQIINTNADWPIGTAD